MWAIFNQMSSIKLLAVGLLTAAPCIHADDLIVFRNGDEQLVKVDRMSDQAIFYVLPSDKSRRQHSALSKDIYLLKMDKESNLYFKPDGKRLTGETQKIQKGTETIYLVEGAEIFADELTVSSDKVIFKRKGKKSLLEAFDLDKVFMVKHKNGTKDIITDITVREPDPEEIAPAPEPVETPPEPQSEPEKVETLLVLHKVTHGETVKSIADRYDVAPGDILEWNNLKAKSTSRLKAGLELKVYVKPQ